MANHMETYVEARNLNQKGVDFLNDLFKLPEGEYEVSSLLLAERFYNMTENQVNRESMVDKFGSKWVYVESDEIDLDYAHFNITSAWSVPVDFLQNLANRINEVQGTNDAVLIGTYEDEGYDPCGAFIYGLNYDDIEDVYGTSAGCLEFDHDKYWGTDDVEADDEYIDNVREELFKERESMFTGFMQYINEMNSEKI